MTGRLLLLLLLFLPGSLVSTRSFFLGTAKKRKKKGVRYQSMRGREIGGETAPRKKGRCGVGIAL